MHDVSNKTFLEQKPTETSVINRIVDSPINLVPNTWSSEKNAIKKFVQNWYFDIVRMAMVRVQKYDSFILF